MKSAAWVCLRLAQTLGRSLLLLLLVAAGTVLLMRFAPGYFTDVREMDGKYAEAGRADMLAEQAQHGSLGMIARGVVIGWLHADFGRSRQFDVPVGELIRPRLRVTAALLARGIVYGWLAALTAAVLLSGAGARSAVLAAPFTLLLAVPTGALATLCLLANAGGAVLVLTLILAARDFKFLQRLLKQSWKAPHLLHARASGLRLPHLFRMHIIPNVLPRVIALATLSFVTALSAIVPIEVLFDQPGLGQLAWGAAMNRDLPVLVSVTLLMAAAVGFAGIFSDRLRSPELV